MRFTLILLLASVLFSGCTASRQATGPEEERNYIPPDTNVPNEEIPYPTINNLPWAGQPTQVLIWALCCAQDTADCDTSAYVDVDWWQVFEVDASGQEKLIYFQGYDSVRFEGLNEDEGGVFVRYPWWYETDNHRNMDWPVSTIKDGCLRVKPMLAADGICHWWTPRLEAKRDRVYRVRVHFRIHGKASFQLGSDYWKRNAQHGGDNVNNLRAWNSKWLGEEDGGWQEITFPLYIFFP
ncbi:MAG: hypothetical protein Q8P32_00175 [Candidatus Komeilibacteria bacterium]|nr:hypothetical protein [Candidatus Komeilibacteria bacterium]